MNLAEPFDLQTAKKTWTEALKLAALFARERPPEELGCLYYSVEEDRFTLPEPGASLEAQGLALHFGTPGGVIPRVAEDNWPAHTPPERLRPVPLVPGWWSTGLTARHSGRAQIRPSTARETGKEQIPPPLTGGSGPPLGAPGLESGAYSNEPGGGGEGTRSLSVVWTRSWG